MADFGFVGPSYTAPSIYQDDSELICWYCEKDPQKKDGERGQYALYPTPGQILKCQPQSGEVRGMRPAQNGTVLYAVIANKLYAISATFVPTSLGTLSTSNGQVPLADNGNAIYFADGVNRYAYVYNSYLSAVTSGTVAVGFYTLPNTDGPFTGGGRCDEVDGYIIYPKPASNQWGQTNQFDIYTGSIAGPQVGLKIGSSDNINSLIVSNREVFLLGEYTSECWINVGASPFAFQIIPGTSTQHGCAAPFTVARLGNSFAYVSRDLKGQGIIVVINGYEPEEISTHAVTNTLAGQYIADAFAYTYQLEGHEFYVVTFPSIDLTWVYDISTGYWHKWLSVDSFNVYHRHNSNCQANFQGLVLIGDYLNGSIYALDNNTYTDNGNTIRRLRRAPHLVEDYKREFFSQLQLYFQPGVGLSTGQGSNPQAMLRFSDDGGSTYSNEHWTGIGLTGKYKNRAIWRKLGSSRDRIFEVVVSDPIKAVIISAQLVGFSGEN